MRKLWPFAVGPLVVIGLVVVGRLGEKPIRRALEEKPPAVVEFDSASHTIEVAPEEIMTWLKVTPEETLTVGWNGIARPTNLQESIGSYKSAMLRESHIGSQATEDYSTVDFWIDARSQEAPAAIEALVPPGLPEIGGFPAWTAWAVTMNGPQDPPMPGSDYWLVAWSGSDDDPEEFELTWTATISDLELQTQRTAPYTPSGEGQRGARKPEDYHVEYQWVITEATRVNLTVTCPDLYYKDGTPASISKEQAFPESEWGQPVGVGVTVTGTLHDGREGVTYLEIETNCDQYPMLFDGLDTDFYGDRANLSGAGNKASWKMLVDYDPGAGEPGTASATVHEWYAVDMSHLAVYTARKGHLNDLLLDCEISCFGVTTTLADWRSYTPFIFQQTSWGVVSNWHGKGTPTTQVIQPRIA